MASYPHNGHEQLSDETKALKGFESELQWLAIGTAAFDIISSIMGRVAFLAASVVLLSGRYGRLNIFHFWVVSALLLIQGTGLLTSHHELQLRSGRLGIKANPNSSSLFRGISLKTLFDCVQMIFSIIRLSLSLSGIAVVIAMEHFQVITAFQESVGTRESVVVLIIFYSIALLDSVIVLLGLIYLHRGRKSLRDTARNKLDISEHAYLLDQYVYHIHSECMKEGLFQSTHTTLLDFATMKIESNVNREQHSSILLLHKFESYSPRLIHCSKVLTVLLEIVTWDDWRVILDAHHVCQARCTAAAILLNAVNECPTSFSTLASIPGAYEKIFSLFSPHQEHVSGQCGNEHDDGNVNKHKHDENLKELSLRGLQIMQRLAIDPMNRDKIRGVRYATPLGRDRSQVVHELRHTLEAYRDRRSPLPENRQDAEIQQAASDLLTTLFPDLQLKPDTMRR